MQRAQITSLTSNADAAALETARAALTVNSGLSVLAGGQVSFSVEPASNEGLLAGDYVGFAYVPTTVAKDGSMSAFAWRRWPGGDFAIVAGPGMLVGPRDVPPGARKVISLPLAVTDSKAGGTSTAFPCGIFFHAPSTIG